MLHAPIPSEADDTSATVPHGEALPETNDEATSEADLDWTARLASG